MAGTTRMVFADQLRPGMVMLENCCIEDAFIGCHHPATVHEVDRVHELTVLDFRRTGDLVALIVMDEDGEQHGWSNGSIIQVRIRAELAVHRHDKA